LVFKSVELHLSKEAEDKRYQTHQNSNQDQGYIDFLNKLAIPLKDFVKNEDSHLDYGCGPYSQLSKILEPVVASSEVFDPLFFPSKEIVKEQYDVVTCTEVAEHFKYAAVDWEQLLSTVKPLGILGIMTQFYKDEINYKEWWYKNDPTHVVFYRQETLDYLTKKYQLKVLYNDHRSVIIFQNEKNR
jgi:hypothetical protein